jgi:hypothetical protein
MAPGRYLLTKMTSARRPTRRRTVKSTHHRDVEGFVIGRGVYRPLPAACQAASACEAADEIRPGPARLLAYMLTSAAFTSPPASVAWWG